MSISNCQSSWVSVPSSRRSWPQDKDWTLPLLHLRVSVYSGKLFTPLPFSSCSPLWRALLSMLMNWWIILASSEIAAASSASSRSEEPIDDVSEWWAALTWRSEFQQSSLPKVDVDRWTGRRQRKQPPRQWHQQLQLWARFVFISFFHPNFSLLLTDVVNIAFSFNLLFLH